MRYLSSGTLVACALACASPAAAQTSLTASFGRGAIAEYTNGPNGTSNGQLFSSLGISSMSISQLSATGSWGGTQGNDTAVTAKITFANGTATSFPAAINWVRNAGGGQFDWVGLTIGAGTVVNDGYNLTLGSEKTYILQFAQSGLSLASLLPNDLDGSANAGAALNALNLYFPTEVAAAPLITGPSGGAGATASALSVDEAQTAVTTMSANKAVTWAISGGADGARFAINSGGVITFLSAPDFDAPTDSDGNNSYVLVAEATDANGAISTQTVTVTVRELDDQAPSIAAGQSLSYAENQVAGAIVGTVTATDDVGVTAFRFAASGTQSSADGFYTIDNGGTVRITPAGVDAGVPNNDFESLPNSFDYGIEARDAAANWSASENVTLNVTDRDESPPLVAPNQAFSYAENQGAGALLAAVSASHDVAVTYFRFAASGTATSADGYFTIDAAGRITLTTAGAAAGAASNDFEVAPNSFSLQIEARDTAGNWSAPVAITLDVTDEPEVVNSAPVVGGGQSLSYAENRAADAVVGTVGATDDDEVIAFRFAASGLRTSADGFYSIDNAGVVRITAEGTAVGLANNDHEVAPNSFTYAIEAGDSSGNWSAPADIQLVVTDLPDTPPVLTGPGGSTGSSSTISVPEGTTFVAQVTANVPIGSWTIAGGNDQGRFAIDAAGNISFVAATDFEAPTDSDGNNSYVLTIEGTDADGNSSAQTITVLVTDRPDTPPVITGPGGSTGARAEISVAEGTTTVARLTADAPISSWRIIGGDDEGRFAVDGDGNLSFIGAPDFDAPGDSDTNNSYVLVIEATDANGNRAAQTTTVAVTDVADTPPAITGPSGGPGALASAIAVSEGTSIVTRLTASRPVSWAITGGDDQSRFTIDVAGQISFVAAPDFEAPTDSDRNNDYLLIVEAIAANGERSTQTLTVSVTNVDELQRRLSEIGSTLRGDLRGHAFASLSTMLSFNEGLLGLDGHCAGAGRKPLSSVVGADEQRQDAEVLLARDLSSCKARTRVFVDGGLSVTRFDGEWTTRAVASTRIERSVGGRSALGATLIGTTARDTLRSFDDSRISDRSVQLNVYGRTQLSNDLRLAVFAGLGAARYDFRLQDSDLDVDGHATGKRHVYGAALSGDLHLGRFTLTTDAILSRAVEQLGSAGIDASAGSERGKSLPFRLGRVDLTRLSIPVHLPIIFGIPRDGRDATRLDIGPGLLCQDSSRDSSELECGYQLGVKFRFAPTLRSLVRAEARAEAVDGTLLNSFTIGLQQRFGASERLSWTIDASRQARLLAAENRVMMRIGLAAGATGTR